MSNAFAFSQSVTPETLARTVHRVARARPRISTPQFHVLNLDARMRGGAFDPFLGVDHFHMRVPMFPPHPHAGFCALTYLFEDSEGALVCRDSLGHTAVVHAGDLYWTTAGRGIVHEEVPQKPGHTVHGLQIFVNLPARMKRMPPSVHHLNAPYVPVRLTESGARVRVVVGSFEDATSPHVPVVPVTLLDVSIAPSGTFEHRCEGDANAIAYVLAGNGAFGARSRFVRRDDAATFAHDGDRLRVWAGKQGMRLVLLTGRPLRERVVSRGPFFMSSVDDLEAAFEDYRLGRMGALDASF